MQKNIYGSTAEAEKQEPRGAAVPGLFGTDPDRLAELGPEAEPPEAGTGKPPERRVKRALKILGNICFAVLLLAVAAMVFFIVRSKVEGTPPMVAGHYMFIVLSGSMEPEFSTGSMVFVKPAEPEEIRVNDIVTFRGFAGSSELTTHRVVEIRKDEQEGLLFITKGDANDVRDPDPIAAKNIVGTVSGSLPYLGYFMNFVQTKQGLLICVVVPLSLLIGTEVYGLLKRLEQTVEKNQEG